MTNHTSSSSSDSIGRSTTQASESVSSAAEAQPASSRSAVKDLTTGDPMKLILGFAVPLLGGLLFQQFYNMVDSLIVGRFLGVKALAGVGSTGSINFMIIGFCMGVCNGFAIPLSQQFGARKYAEMRRFFVHSIYLCALFSVVMTTAVCLLCPWILHAMNTPADIYSYAYQYIFLIFLGIPATFLYNLISGAIRALGDSKAPVVFLVISSAVNIVLDLVFILAAHMGVAGAALATVISQLFSGLLSVLYLVRRIELLHIRREEWAFRPHLAKILLVMGVPMGLQYSITAIGSVILQTAVNGLGSVFVAAQTAGGKVSIFFCTPYDALGSTMATWGGQNVGAGRLDRLNKGLKSASILGCSYAVAEFFIMFFFGRQLSSLFLGSATSPEELTLILDSARLFLITNAAFYIPLVFVNVVRFLIQGMGYSGLATLAGVCEMIGRTAAALLLIPRIGYPGACWASPIAWILADAFLLPAYFHVRRKTYAAFGQSRNCP